MIHNYDTIDGWDCEREEADFQQADMERQGEAHGRLMDRVEALQQSGKITAATELCRHGHVGGLRGDCCCDDPRYGEAGARCWECGAHVTDINGEIYAGALVMGARSRNVGRIYFPPNSRFREWLDRVQG